MKRSVLALGVSLLVAFSGFSCGGGGGSDDSSIGNLQGTWFGVIEEYATGTLEEFSLEIDDSGNVIEVTIGKIITGDTGYINEDWDENLFHVRYNSAPGSTNPLAGGPMIVDNQYRHATYGDNNLFFGVLEKGATSLPAYGSSDIVGSYATGGAYEFVFDSSEGYWNWEGEAINMTINSDLTFSGSSQSDSFSGGFNTPFGGPTYGGYAGTLTRNIALPKDPGYQGSCQPGQNFCGSLRQRNWHNPDIPGGLYSDRFGEIGEGVTLSRAVPGPRQQ